MRRFSLANLLGNRRLTQAGKALLPAGIAALLVFVLATAPASLPAVAQGYMLVDADGNDISPDPETGAAATPTLSAFPWLRLDDLATTRDMPLFTPSRTAPSDEPPPVAVEPEPEPEPEPVAESEPPPLRLAGVVASGAVSVAMLQDEESDEMLRISPGQAVLDWILVSVEPRAVTLKQGDREIRLVLAPPGEASETGETWQDE